MVSKSSQAGGASEAASASNGGSGSAEGPGSAEEAGASTGGREGAGRDTVEAAFSEAATASEYPS
ncbi:MAG: hypothetical protein O3C45_09070, partial [Bacteroidetes bacterium]|nr:hypothetical protein [Bacteroidota bacterium]